MRTKRSSEASGGPKVIPGVVVSGALTCIVREVVGWLGPTGGASTPEGQNRAQSTAHGAGNIVAAVQ